MRMLLRRLRVVVLLGFEVAVVVALHRLGAESWLQIDWSDLGGWLETTVAEDALAAVIRYIALGLAYWMLATTALYLLARILRIPAALRAIEWATIPAVRRVVDGAVAVSIATAAVAGPVTPALAQVPTPVVIEVDEDGRPVPPGTADEAATPPEASNERDPVVIVPPGLDRIGWTPTPAGVPDTPTTLSDVVDAATAAVADATTTADTAAPGSVVVAPGDHLWSIAERHLTATTGERSDEASVARYWRRVIDANRDRLRSGDPDLIYPGETVYLPPIEMEDE